MIAASLAAVAIVTWGIFLAAHGDRDLRKTIGWVIGLSTGLVAPLGHLTGTVLGIVGLVKKNRRRSLALVGTIVNGLFVVGAILLFIVGLSGMGAR